MSNSQLNKLKSATKNGTDVLLRLSSNMISNSDDKANFPHKLLLTNRQVANIRKAFANYTSTDIKLSKAQLTKMQKGGFLRFLAPLLKSGLPLLKSVIKLLGMLGLTAAASATDAAINKKILESGNHATLLISNDDMQDLLKIVKSLEDSGLLLDGITETVKNEVKEQKGGFLGMLLGTLGASLLGNILAGRGVIRAGEVTIRTGYGSKKIINKPLTNFEIEAYYQNEPRFNDVYSRDNLPDKTKDGAYLINLDEYPDIGAHWIALYVNNKTVTYVDSFEIEHISKKVKKFVNNKNVIANIFRTQAYDSVMCGYFCIRFIDYMFMGKSLTEYANLFSPNNFKKNDDIILNYFLNKL